MSEPMSEAPAVISAYATGDYHVSTIKTSPLTEYVRKDIFDAYKAVVDYLLSPECKSLSKLVSLAQAARKAGESVR